MASFHRMLFVLSALFLFFFLAAAADINMAGGSNFDLLGHEYSGREEMVKWAGYGEEKLSTVIIAGTILCNAADQQHAPVSGAKVVVLCGSNRKLGRRLASAKGSTDGSGKFEIDLPSHLHAIPNLEKVCHVKVVNLPATSPCRKACTAKHNKPISLASVHHGIRTYTTQNIHFTPPN